MSTSDDFVDSFLSLTEGAVSPRVFRLWTAISLIGSAMGRRIWTKTDSGRIYPNFYILLVGPPGAGKRIIGTAKEILRATTEPNTKVPAFKVASNSVTSATIIDELAKAKFMKLASKGHPIVYHSLIFTSEELQVLLPGYDTTIIGKLNELYNNIDGEYTETRRTGSVREVAIENPSLCILAGAQPAYFSSTFPEDVWSTGFARRMIMIYSDEVIVKPFWNGRDDLEEFETADWRKGVQQRLSLLSAVPGVAGLGGFLWTKEAAGKHITWHMSGGPPAPQHSKLAQYLRERSVNIVKLSMISALSRGDGALVVELRDVERAIDWLLEAELRMPDIFRAMIGKSDSQVIEEMHYYVTHLWASKKQKPVPGDQIMRFLLHRVPTDKAEKIMQMAERANILARVAGTQDLFVPKPKAEHDEAE